jgi:hypothetical protein|tara:strand:- start:1201 stop:1635 length:435 start_codon:yes stop_codon:yes gene_type:complete
MSKESETLKTELVEIALKHIDVSKLTSVLDDNSPVTAEYVVSEGKKLIEAFPTGIQLENIMDAVIIVLGTANKINNLTSEQKKDFICDILIYVVDNTDAGALESLDPVIKKLIPNVIDTILRVEDGKLSINANNNCFSKLPCFH